MVHHCAILSPGDCRSRSRAHCRPSARAGVGVYLHKEPVPRRVGGAEHDVVPGAVREVRLEIGGLGLVRLLPAPFHSREPSHGPGPANLRFYVIGLGASGGRDASPAGRVPLPAWELKRFCPPTPASAAVRCCPALRGALGGRPPRSPRVTNQRTWRGDESRDPWSVPGTRWETRRRSTAMVGDQRW